MNLTVKLAASSCGNTDIRAIATDYELHLGATPFGPDGNFENTRVQVMHPDRTIVHSEGNWGGRFSNIPDQDGNPRLATGVHSGEFEESDGGSGSFTGSFIALAAGGLPRKESGSWLGQDSKPGNS